MIFDAEIGETKVRKKPGATGLEPATSGSTVQSSNQLSYTPTWENYNGRMRARTSDLFLVKEAL